jgi:thiol:disulfide interchange protein/DsbC/DsbD-like thiol-disulfide interchange protein
LYLSDGTSDLRLRLSLDATHTLKPPMQRPSILAALAAAILTFAASTHAFAEPVRTPHLEAELIASRTALTPGQPLTVALRLAMQRGWQTYWQNPGDSGLPTTIEWTLPPGMSAGPIQWPAPRALPVGPLVNYGYEGEVLLLVDIATKPDFQIGKTATLSARADWLVCKEICIPEGADLALTLPVSTHADADPRWGEPIAAALAALPRPLAGWHASATGVGDNVELTLNAESGAPDPGKLQFFPFADGKIEPAGAQIASRDGARTTLTLPVARQRVGEFTRVAGVLTASNGLGTQHAATIDVPLSGTIASTPATRATPTPAALPAASMFTASAEPALPFFVAIAFAFMGGVLLNLMPCVFPVLSLKVLGFATHGDTRLAMRMHGLAFATGVLVSFWLLAAGLVALRAAGQQLGWGFQLQSPAVVVALAILFFALALNFSGVFEVRQLLPSALAGWNARNPYVNDALSGVLAVVVASPCSAPFMGAALGYALTESALVTWLTFTALGLGMAMPYLLLAFFPAWRAKLPRPGPWMVRLRQLLAFPLYATVLWLAWVLGAQLDNDAVARLGALLLLVAFALWLWPAMHGGNRLSGTAIIAAVAGAVAIGWPLVNAMATDDAGNVRTARPDSGAWHSFSADRVAQLTSNGRPVFVDFTAAWCVTCQVNKQLVLNTDAVQQAFVGSNVALVRADWTRRDPEIGRALAALGRDGVPVYVLYRPGKAPLLLPEVLQQRMILDALATL